MNICHSIPFAALSIFGLSSSFLPLSAQQTPFNTIPDWISVAGGKYGTGLGIADINGDDWEDIIVANGNDMNRQRVEVYFNNGDGTFPRSPGWQSGDIDYHGMLAAGDINSDGWIDVAVSVFLGESRFGDPGHVKVYMNRTGTLENLPSWRSADSMETFSCALGDADGDGDLDLAVAIGQPYPEGSVPYVAGTGRVYFNNNGTLGTLPGWESSNQMCAMDVEFEDFNNDGYLDLLFSGQWTQHVLFFGNGTSFDSDPSPVGHDTAWSGNSVATGFLNDDGYPDYAISENNQLGGDGRSNAYIYRSPIDSSPSLYWTESAGGYGSAIWIEDVNNDAASDIILGSWWGPVEVYAGNADSITTAPVWVSQTGSVIESFVFRDLDNAAHEEKDQSFVVTEEHPGGVVILERTNIERILFVRLNGIVLNPGIDYCTVPGAHWVSIKDAAIGDEVIVRYSVSPARDLVVTNWDSNIGNYIFYNTNGGTSVPDPPVSRTLDIEVYPIPSGGPTTFSIAGLPPATAGTLSVYNALGVCVYAAELQPGPETPVTVIWSGTTDSGNRLPAGVYMYMVRTVAGAATGIVVLM